MLAYLCITSHIFFSFLHAVYWAGNSLIRSSSWQVVVPASAEASTCPHAEVQLQV